jgi:dienelactone hydrolase
MLYILSALLPLLVSTVQGFVLPAPPGEYNVTLTTGPLVDYSREAWALMISIFQPATCACTIEVPNMPEKTARYQASWAQEMLNITTDFSPLLLGARLPVCARDSNNTTPVEDSPVLVLSHGAGGSRLYHNIIASAIASHGFTVITTDHPSDSNIIEYPDGHAIYPNFNNTTPDRIARLVQVRAADALFIIDQLSNATAMAKLGVETFPTDRVAMLGHSLGGATSVYAAGQDDRIRAAINWDGALWNPIPSSGISQPVQLVASERETDASWETAWPQFQGPKLWTKIAGLKHMGFIDLKATLKAAGQDTETMAELLGTIGPDELNNILVTYTTEWIKGAFAGKVGGPLLEGEEPDRFPAVSILERGGY